MKRRTGFVSNSSSASFLIAAKKPPVISVPVTEVEESGINNVHTEVYENIDDMNISDETHYAECEEALKKKGMKLYEITVKYYSTEIIEQLKSHPGFIKRDDE